MAKRSTYPYMSYLQMDWTGVDKASIIESVRSTEIVTLFEFNIAKIKHMYSDKHPEWYIELGDESYITHNVQYTIDRKNANDQDMMLQIFLGEMGLHDEHRYTGTSQEWDHSYFREYDGWTQKRVILGLGERERSYDTPFMCKKNPNKWIYEVYMTVEFRHKDIIVVAREELERIMTPRYVVSIHKDYNNPQRGHPDEMYEECRQLLLRDYPEDEYNYYIDQPLGGSGKRRERPDVMVKKGNRVICAAEIGNTSAKKINMYWDKLKISDIRWYTKKMELVYHRKDGLILQTSNRKEG